MTRHLKYEKTIGDAMRIFRRHISLHFLLVFAPFSPHEFNKKIKKMQPCELSTSFSLFQWRYYLIIKINISMVPHQHRTVQLFYRKTGIVASLIFFLFKTLNSERVWGAQFKKNNIGSILLTCMYFKMFE